MDIKSKKYIEIRPNSKLKFFFWSDPFRLPKDDDILNNFSKKGIEFVIALGKHTMNAKCYNRIQSLIDNNIEINVCILDKDFAHLDNSHKFKEIYKMLRNSNIFNYVKEIYIDAEISKKYRKNIKNRPLNKKLTYIFNKHPNKNEIIKAIRDYNRLINSVHSDNKRFGIVRSISSTYEIEKITRNVPFDEIDEDITATMVYRVPEGREKEYKDFWFYQVAKKEGDNIFLGDIKDGYRSLKEDITICSYLKKKRVYIYDYYGFKKFNKLEDLEPYKRYKIKKDVWEFVKHTAKVSSFEIADKFLKFFK